MTQQHRPGDIAPNGQVFLKYVKGEERWGSHDDLLKQREAYRQWYREHREEVIKNNALHGGAVHSWRAMKQRCSNPKQRGYGGVGAKGIRVCKRW